MSLQKLEKIFEDFGPLLIFFVLNSKGAAWFGLPASQSLFIATGGFMVALIVAIVMGLARGRKPSLLTLISAGFVLFFGALTLWLQDETFIKIKPTVVYTLFGAILASGLLRGISYLQRLMDTMLPMSEEGWMILTRRWTIFFFALALINEICWRHLTTDQWVNVKVFGFLGLTIIFTLAQIPLFARYGRDTD